MPTWRSPPPTATYQLHVSANASWKRGDVVETARREWYAAIDRKSRTATLILDYRDMERTIAQAGKPVETIPSPLRKTYLKLDAATLKSGRPLEEREIIQRDADDVLRDRAGLSGIYVDRTWRGGEPRDLDRDALAILERELKRLLPGVRVERAKLGVRSEMLGKQATFHLELAIADEGTAAITLGGELTVSILDGQALELELEGPGASIRVAWQTATF